MTGALLATVLTILTIPVQSPITVTMAATGVPVLVPGAIGKVQGIEWVQPGVFLLEPLEGAEVLGGYVVRLGGLPCRMRYVGSTHLLFIVPDDIAPGTRTLEVAGPAGAFSASVVVDPYQPVLLEQRGFVVAMSSAAMFPRLYIHGEAIPVSPMTYNFLGVQAVGLPYAVFTPVTVILEGREHYEIAGRAGPLIGFPGTTNVMWFAPPCADGDYAMRVRAGEVTSPPAVIRFTADCRITGQGARIRRSQ